MKKSFTFGLEEVVVVPVPFTFSLGEVVAVPGQETKVERKVDRAFRADRVVFSRIFEERQT